MITLLKNGGFMDIDLGSSVFTKEQVKYFSEVEPSLMWKANNEKDNNPILEFWKMKRSIFIMNTRGV